MALYSRPNSVIFPGIHQLTAYESRSFSNLLEYDYKRASRNVLQKSKRRACYDWIFSSSTNAHVAIDKSVFKTYTPFSSYVLVLADQRRVEVRGIGAVELRIRCKPGSRSDRSIILDNVLHVPHWMCNIFSDIYFLPTQDYEHNWSDFGVNFMVQEKGRLRYWGYTENFRGLDRLILSRKHEGRSPMLEDKDREVFSVNLTWPQGQREKWEHYLAARSAWDLTSQRLPKQVHSRSDLVFAANRRKSEDCLRAYLGEVKVDNNVMPPDQLLGKKKSGLRAAVSHMNLSHAIRSRRDF